jgi:hypothetical protein
LLRLCPKETFVVHFRYLPVDVSHPILLFMESIGLLWRNNTTFGQSPSPYPYQGNPPRRNILKRVREHVAP